MRRMIGDMEADAILSGKPFLFSVSEYPLDDASPEAQMRLLDARMQIALTFFSVLWLMKDNSIDFGQGFLQHPYGSATARISVNNWTTRYSKADGQFTETRFSKAELREAISVYGALYGPRSNDDVSASLAPGSAGEVDRISRSLFFLQGARAMRDPAQKVTNYCIGFEALVSTSNAGLAHQVAERVAILIGRDSHDALEVYTNIKKAYGTRSKMVHGDQLKPRVDEYLSQALACDDYLRRLLHVTMTRKEVAEVITQKQEILEQFFLRNLLQISTSAC